MLLLDMFFEVTARMCEGEILEQQMRTDGMEPSLEVYLHVTEAKTAGLISVAARQALAGYGQALGLLFQITDDIADGNAALGITLFWRSRQRNAAEAPSPFPSACRATTQWSFSELSGDILSASCR